MATEILITGDFCPIGRNEKKIICNDFSIFGDMLTEIQNTDWVVTNLEAPITTGASAIPKNGPNLKANKNTARVLKEAGVNLVTTANNHIQDYGADGVIDTLEALEREGLSYVGCGKNLTEARKPYIISQGDEKIGILNFAENEFCIAEEDYPGANPVNLVNNYYDISTLKKEVSFLVVISHGGREHYQLPTPKTRERYRFYIDCGADLVVGHHPHCISGYEQWNNKYIFYSLGNFVFDYKKKYQTGQWTKGMALKIWVKSKLVKFELIPYHQGRADDPTLTLLRGKDRIQVEKEISEISEIIANESSFQQMWNRQIDRERRAYMANLQIPNKYIRAVVSRGWLPWLRPSKQHLLLLLNLFRCETHNEIMQAVLRNFR